MAGLGFPALMIFEARSSRLLSFDPASELQLSLHLGPWGRHLHRSSFATTALA
jgi:hypothetical protein